MSLLRLLFVLLFAVLVAAPASAQSRGIGRLTGKVVDEAGKPLAEVQVKAIKVGEAEPFEAKTNKKGEWTLAGLAGGDWNVDFIKDGLETVQRSIRVSEGQRIAPLAVTMKPAPPPAADPREEINKHMAVAAEHIKANRVVEARKIYEDLLAKFPQVHQFHNFIGRTYAAENNNAEAIRHVRIAYEKEPESVETKMLLAELLMANNEKEEAQKLLATIDLSQAKDPFVFVNVAINQINDGKAQEAVDLLTKLIAHFPNEPQLLYYRGRAYLAASKFEEAKADLEKFIAANPQGVDKEIEDAKKILEQLVKK